jgi:hypothetical protein
LAPIIAELQVAGFRSFNAIARHPGQPIRPRPLACAPSEARPSARRSGLHWSRRPLIARCPSGPPPPIATAVEPVAEGRGRGLGAPRSAY